MDWSKKRLEESRALIDHFQSLGEVAVVMMEGSSLLYKDIPNFLLYAESSSSYLSEIFGL